MKSFPALPPMLSFKDDGFVISDPVDQQRRSELIQSLSFLYPLFPSQIESPNVHPPGLPLFNDYSITTNNETMENSHWYIHLV